MAVQAASPFAVTSGRGRRRRMVGRLMEGLSTLAALLAIVVLALVVYAVARRGLSALSVDFFTKVPGTDAFGNPTGGLSNALVGSLVITALATVIAVPFGVLIAVFNNEFAPARVADAVRLMLNVLAGIPTVVIGVFVFGLMVENSTGFALFGFQLIGAGYSAEAAAVALSIVMVPLIARSTEEVLALVPSHLREGGMALGATRARTVLTVILPTAVGGIVTSTIVAVARAAGETAPLLFTSAIFANAVVTDPTKAMGSLPIAIYEDSELPSKFAQQQAWAAALVLMAVVLIGAIAGRLLSLRSRRQIERAR